MLLFSSFVIAPGSTATLAIVKTSGVALRLLALMSGMNEGRRMPGCGLHVRQYKRH